MEIREKLKKIRDNIKTPIVATFVMMTSYAMGQTPNNDKSNDRKSDKIELGGVVVLEGEGNSSGTERLNQADALLIPNISLEKDNIKLEAGTTVAVSNYIEDKFQAMCLELYAQASAKFGKGELQLKAGKMSMMSAGTSASHGNVSISNNFDFLINGGGGTLNNALLVGYKTPKGSIDIGWIGSDQSSTTIFDFGKFKGGKAVVIMDNSPKDNIFLRGMTITNMKKINKAQLSGFYDNSNLIGGVDFVYSNDCGEKSLLTAITAKKTLAKDLAAYTQHLIKKTDKSPMTLSSVLGIQYNGAYIQCGVEKKSKLAAFVSVGYKKTIDLGKAK